MSTELNKVVHSMSQISIPQDILNKVDMKNLLKGFSDDYKKLDDLKAARLRHEDRNFISRWWNNNELEDAQLDAAELQASFSKKLGQLMVISVAQSQQLHQQQNGLSEQQNTIKRQTDQLAKNDEHLKEQQLSLEEQNKKLEKLVTEYFELKGLTQDGALKLVKIANEVKVTKDSLLMNFDDRMKEIERTRKGILDEQAKLAGRQTQQLNTFKTESENRLDAYKQQIEQRIKHALAQIVQTGEKLRQALTIIEQRITDNQAKALEQQKQLQAEYEQHQQCWEQEAQKQNTRLDALHADNNRLQQQLDEQAGQHQQQIENLHQLLSKLQVESEQHQQCWEQEAQKQNTRLDALHVDNNRLQQQLDEQAGQHQQQIENLHQLLNNLNEGAELRELNWGQRWKTMTRTVTGALSVLTIALAYLAYTSYYHIPLF